MKMADLADNLYAILSLTSVQILILGVAALMLFRLGRVRSKEGEHVQKNK
jgi:hypothetical protein